MTGVVTPLPVHHRWRDYCVLEAEQLDVYALAVVAALHVHMRGGVATVGLRRLAQVARCTVGTVRARIADLERAGLLKVHQEPGHRTVYVATLPADEPADGDDEPAEVRHPTGQGVSPDDTPEPEEVCHPTTTAVSPGDTHLCRPTTHVPLTPVEPLRARAREAPPARQPMGRKRRRKRRDRSTPPLAAGRGGGGPTPRRAPVPWQVEVRPDGTWWVRQVAS